MIRKNQATLTSSLLTLIASVIALVAFLWPLLITAEAANQSSVAQLSFMLITPLLLVLLVTEYSAFGLGARQLAVLAVLIALNSVVRLLGAGVAGIETAFFIVIIAAYVFGSNFGFLLGSGSLLLSALISGGIGPWLPFQMMAMGLVGIGAGFLPRTKHPTWLLIAFAVPASFAYGALMTMWNWPYLAGVGSSISYLPGGGLIENTARFLKFEIVTGGLLWDLGRTITTVVLIAVTATTLLATLNRAAGRAVVVKLDN